MSKMVLGYARSNGIEKTSTGNKFCLVEYFMNSIINARDNNDVHNI